MCVKLGLCVKSFSSAIDLISKEQGPRQDVIIGLLDHITLPFHHINERTYWQNGKEIRAAFRLKDNRPLFSLYIVFSQMNTKRSVTCKASKSIMRTQGSLLFPKIDFFLLKLIFGILVFIWMRFEFLFFIFCREAVKRA